MIQSHTYLAVLAMTLSALVMTATGQVVDPFGNGTIKTPTTASGGTGTVANLQTDDDVNYTVAKSATASIGGFGTHGSAITSVYLFVQYSVEAGYTGTNAIQVNGVNTTIVPAVRDYGRWAYVDITAGSFGVNTSAEISTLSVTFTNNHSGTGKSVFLDCAYVVVNPQTAIPAPPTWSEDFNGTGQANPMVWNYEVGYQRNSEAQYYVAGASNGWMEGGNFIIEGRKEPINGYQYTSASIVSTNKYYWKFGRAQIRAKIPAKVGMWPAIWGTGEVGQWPHNGEVDILEYYDEKILANVAVGDTAAWTAKWDGANRSMASLLAVDSNWRNEWHIWTMQWDELNIRIYVDNILVNTIPQTWMVNTAGYNTSWGPQYPFQSNGMSCWLNLAMGGVAGGDPTATMNSGPQRYLIDYWKVWEGATSNDAPTDIALSSSSVAQGLAIGTVVGNLSATDADPAEVHRYTLVTGTGSTHNSQFSIPEFISGDTLQGVLKTAAVINYADGATRSIRVRVTDIEGATYEKVFTINVAGLGSQITSVSPSSGLATGGTTVTITGTGLTGTSAVTFGGTAATSVTVVSATQVTCVTPAKSAGVVDVVLTTPSGSLTKTGAFTYNSVSPGTLALSAATYSVTENAGSATITVTRSGGSVGAASVQYATSNGTATAGSDYTAVSGTLNWVDGDSSSKTFTIPITNDTAIESNKTVSITLSSATGATLGTQSTAVLTIVDEDSQPIVLVGGNIRNGNFNNPSGGATFTNLANWTNLGNAGQDIAATKIAEPYDSSPYAELGYLSGSKIFAVDTERTLVQGDVFDVSYVWKDGWLWNDGSHRVAVSLYVTSDNTITGTQTVLVTSNSNLSTLNNTYEAVDQNAIYTATAGVVGKRLFVKIATTNTAEAYAFLDNFELLCNPVPTYAVTYNANGATSGAVPSAQTKTQGVNLTLATNSGNLTKSNSTFAGWNTAADGSGDNYAGGSSYTANAALILYAKWTALSPFEVWAVASGVTFTGDANKDGTADGLAWLLGADAPSSNANALLPTPSGSNGDLISSFKALKANARGSAILKLQYSRDIGISDLWASHTVNVPETSSTQGGVQFVVIQDSLNSNLNQVQATVPASAAAGTGKIFVRLSAEAIAP